MNNRQLASLLKAIAESTNSISDAVLEAIRLIEQETQTVLELEDSATVQDHAPTPLPDVDKKQWTPPVVEDATPTDDDDRLTTFDPEQTEGRFIPWGKQADKAYGREFIEGVLWIEAQLGLNAEYLMACMKFESNINHKARNRMSSASGLIQFMSFTAKNLGTNITTIRESGPMEQLSFVYKYFKEFADRGMDLKTWSLNDTYMAILWPAGIGKSSDYPIFLRGRGRAYAVNRGLDLNKDGTVTVGEAATRVSRLYDQGMAPENVLVV